MNCYPHRYIQHCGMDHQIPVRDRKAQLKGMLDSLVTGYGVIYLKHPSLQRPPEEKLQRAPAASPRVVARIHPDRLQRPVSSLDFVILGLLLFLFKEALKVCSGTV